MSLNVGEDIEVARTRNLVRADLSGKITYNLTFLLEIAGGIEQFRLQNSSLVYPWAGKETPDLAYVLYPAPKVGSVEIPSTSTTYYMILEQSGKFSVYDTATSTRQVIDDIVVITYAIDIAEAPNTPEKVVVKKVPCDCMVLVQLQDSGSTVKNSYAKLLREGEETMIDIADVVLNMEVLSDDKIGITIVIHRDESQIINWGLSVDGEEAYCGYPISEPLHVKVEIYNVLDQPIIQSGFSGSLTAFITGAGLSAVSSELTSQLTAYLGTDQMLVSVLNGIGTSVSAFAGALLSTLFRFAQWNWIKSTELQNPMLLIERVKQAVTPTNLAQLAGIGVGVGVGSAVSQSLAQRYAAMVPSQSQLAGLLGVGANVAISGVGSILIGKILDDILDDYGIYVLPIA